MASKYKIYLTIRELQIAIKITINIYVNILNKALANTMLKYIKIVYVRIQLMSHLIFVERKYYLFKNKNKKRVKEHMKSVYNG